MSGSSYESFYWVLVTTASVSYCGSFKSQSRTDTHSGGVLDEVGAAGALVNALGEDAIVDGHLRLPHQLAERGVICNTTHNSRQLHNAQ